MELGTLSSAPFAVQHGGGEEGGHAGAFVGVCDSQPVLMALVWTTRVCTAGAVPRTLLEGWP